MLFKMDFSPVTDGLVDGMELTKLPHPLVIDQAGTVYDNSLVRAVIGFVGDPARMEIDIHWVELFVAGRPIYQIVGKYAVVQGPDGRWSTLVTAISAFAPLEARRDPGELEGGERSNGVHAAHCCIRHGCKYGDPQCPVMKKVVTQEYDCEMCDEDAERQPVTLAELHTLLADFAAEVEMDVMAERPEWGDGTTAQYEKIAEKLGIRR
jgi:hypothetical protein